jgi:hypothetical protein
MFIVAMLLARSRLFQPGQVVIQVNILQCLAFPPKQTLYPWLP